MTYATSNPFCRPGRIHHCMRSIGAAQMALDAMLVRVTDPSRKTFGKYLYEHGNVSQYISSSRMLTPILKELLSLISQSQELRLKVHACSSLVQPCRYEHTIFAVTILVEFILLQIDKHKAKGALKEIGIAKVR